MKKGKKGGKNTYFNISCGQCGTFVFKYLKIGKGGILRCYLRRIETPTHFASLLDQPIHKASELPNLYCPECNELLGTPTKRDDGRYAFRMRPGYFHKKIMK